MRNWLKTAHKLYRDAIETIIAFVTVFALLLGFPCGLVLLRDGHTILGPFIMLIAAVVVVGMLTYVLWQPVKKINQRVRDERAAKQEDVVLNDRRYFS